MLLIKQLELIERIHKQVMNAHTGTPREFASYLGISERHLYEVIDEMKSMGAPIRYSRTHLSYFYTKEVKASLSCSFTILSHNEEEIIKGGGAFYGITLY